MSARATSPARLDAWLLSAAGALFVIVATAFAHALDDALIGAILGLAAILSLTTMIVIPLRAR